jgi:hypothetical protein
MTNHKVDQKQREALVALVEKAERNEKERLEDEHGIDGDSILRMIADEMGAGEFIKRDEQLEKQIEALQAARNKNCDEFQELGFDLEDGEFKLKWDASSSLREAVRRKKKDLSEPFKKYFGTYASAIARIWTASSEEELQKAVEGLF